MKFNGLRPAWGGRRRSARLPITNCKTGGKAGEKSGRLARNFENNLGAAGLRMSAHPGLLPERVVEIRRDGTRRVSTTYLSTAARTLSVSFFLKSLGNWEPSPRRTNTRSRLGTTQPSLLSLPRVMTRSAGPLGRSGNVHHCPP